MEQVSNISDIHNLKNNKIIVNDKDTVRFTDSVIKFSGNNNIVYIEDGVFVNGSSINFCKNNSILFIRKSNSKIMLSVTLYNSSVIYLGCDNYFNGRLNLIASEGRHIFIGDDCLFSFGIWFRNSDAHLIYDSDSNKRINRSQSIYIGDHVWIGQNSLILKNTFIGSGSIIGAGSVLSGKNCSSNSVFAGNPAKKIRSNIFFLSDCSHAFTEEDTEISLIKNEDKYKYNLDDKSIDFIEFDKRLTSLKNIEERFAFVEKNILNNYAKNRFSI